MTQDREDPWLRHDPQRPEGPAGQPREVRVEDGWLRHDVADPAGSDPEREGSIRSYAARAAYEPRHRAAPAHRDGAPESTSGEPGHGRRGGMAVLWAAVKEFVIVIGMALVLSFVVKTWLLQAFYIPSGSMEDTLVLNDRVIVSKLTPGPVDLERGDIVVFADPGDWLSPPPEVERGRLATMTRDALTFVGLLPDTSENHLIKRVIGLPGDHVVCCDEGQRITINGVPVKEPYVKPGNPASDCSFDVVVPRGRVWVMGDHRNNSADSRPHDVDGDGRLGSVDERLIVGRAVALVWPLDHLTWLSNPSAAFRDVPEAAAPTEEPAAAAGLQDLRPCVAGS